MNVLNFKSATAVYSAPILMLVDLQKEYCSEGRAYHLVSAGRAFDNCCRLLDFFRENRLPIAHFRQASAGQFFNKVTRFAQWIDGLNPRPNEYVFERELPSCFSNTSFSELTKSVIDPELIIAGMSGERACLSTAVECFHRGYRTTFVHDCSASAEMGGRTETEAHEVITQIMSLYCNTEALEVVVDRLARRCPQRVRT